MVNVNGNVTINPTDADSSELLILILQGYNQYFITNFDLNVLANFSVGNLIYDGGQAFTDNLNGDFNKGTAVLDY
jgi:hypothetical protein